MYNSHINIRLFFRKNDWQIPLDEAEFKNEKGPGERCYILQDLKKPLVGARFDDRSNPYGPTI